MWFNLQNILYFLLLSASLVRIWTRSSSCWHLHHYWTLRQSSFLVELGFTDQNFLLVPISHFFCRNDLLDPAQKHPLQVCILHKMVIWIVKSYMSEMCKILQQQNAQMSVGAEQVLLQVDGWGVTNDLQGQQAHKLLPTSSTSFQWRKSIIVLWSIIVLRNRLLHMSAISIKFEYLLESVYLEKRYL